MIPKMESKKDFLKSGKNRLFIMTILVVAFVGACSSTMAPTPTDGKSYVAKQSEGITEISADELRSKLATDDELVLLDVRSIYEREKGRTIVDSGEIHIPRGFLELKAWETVPKDKPVVVYCAKGARGKLAAATLADMGWSNVVNLKGGINNYYQSIDEDCGCVDLPF